MSRLSKNRGDTAGRSLIPGRILWGERIKLNTSVLRWAKNECDRAMIEPKDQREPDRRVARLSRYQRLVQQIYASVHKIKREPAVGERLHTPDQPDRGPPQALHIQDIRFQRRERPVCDLKIFYPRDRRPYNGPGDVGQQTASGYGPSMPGRRRGADQRHVGPRIEQRRYGSVPSVTVRMDRVLGVKANQCSAAGGGRADPGAFGHPRVIMYSVSFA